MWSTRQRPNILGFLFHVNCVIFKYFIIGVEKWFSVESASTLLCTYEDPSLNPRFRVHSGRVAHICNTSASVGSGRRRQENPWLLVDQLAGRKQWTTHQRPSLEWGRRQEPTPEVDLWPLYPGALAYTYPYSHTYKHAHTCTQSHRYITRWWMSRFVDDYWERIINP